MKIIEFFDWLDQQHIMYLDDIQQKLKEMNAPADVQKYFSGQEKLRRWYPQEVKAHFNKLHHDKKEA